VRLGLVCAASLLAAFVVACGGGDSGPRPTPTLLPPEISPALRVIGEGSLDLDVAPGGRQFIEPLKLAEAFGTPPDCASLAFLFRWRVHGNGELRFEGQLRGSVVAVEQGNTGSASVGCMVVEAVNDSSKPIKGDVRYYIAAAR
jgi:hypothetical protein